MKLACIQMNSGADWSANLATALEYVRQAAQDGATLIALPENVLAMMPRTEDLFALPLAEMADVYLRTLQDIANTYHCSILGGTLPFLVNGEKRLFNRSYLVSESGSVFYDKIHLCDINLPGGASLHESQYYKPGEKVVLADTALGKTGLTICYDLRFPNLFRQLAKSGAEIIAVPSAFTVPTGKAHWHSLLRARAIENGCYIIAPAQVGAHPGNRHTFGHSLIVDPWGEIHADSGTETGITTAGFNRTFLNEVRQNIPSLQHDRPLLA